MSIYKSITISQFVSPLSVSPSPLSVHTFVFYICVSISALQTGSSIPLFSIPHICVNIYLFFSDLLHSVWLTQQSHYWAYTLRKPKWIKHMHPSVHCSTVHNSQDMEATWMPIVRRMDKKDVVHIYNRILLSHKKERNWAIWRDMGGPRGCHTEWPIIPSTFEQWTSWPLNPALRKEAGFILGPSINHWCKAGVRKDKASLTDLGIQVYGL